MKHDICLDAGVLGIYFSVDCTAQVHALMNDVREGKVHSCIVKPVVSEVFFHLCKGQGVSEATTQLVNLFKLYPIELVDMDQELLFSAGKLRCQHASTLSYIDCMSIAYCLASGAAFHTTEKRLKRIPNSTIRRLQVVTYAW